MIFLIILVDVLLFKDPGGRKVTDPLDPDPQHRLQHKKIDYFGCSVIRTVFTGLFLHKNLALEISYIAKKSKKFNFIIRNYFICRISRVRIPDILKKRPDIRCNPIN